MRFESCPLIRWKISVDRNEEKKIRCRQERNKEYIYEIKENQPYCQTDMNLPFSLQIPDVMIVSL
jgi:hypothetical protein